MLTKELINREGEEGVVCNEDVCEIESHDMDVDCDGIQPGCINSKSEFETICRLENRLQVELIASLWLGLKLFFRNFQ